MHEDFDQHVQLAFPGAVLRPCYCVGLTAAIAVEEHSAVFFFQAEDGIRDYKVTGVQTCALPISGSERRLQGSWSRWRTNRGREDLPAILPQCAVTQQIQIHGPQSTTDPPPSALQIGRASCRERV